MYAKSKKPGRKGQILYDPNSNYKMSKKANLDTEVWWLPEHMGDRQGWRETAFLFWGDGNYCGCTALQRQIC